MGFSRLKVPYIVRGGVRFFEQAHIKDIMAYFRVTENIRDEVSWRRLFTQTEGIGSKTSDILIPYILSMDNLDDIVKNLGKGDIKIRAYGKLTALLRCYKLQSINNIPAELNL